MLRPAGSPSFSRAHGPYAFHPPLAVAYLDINKMVKDLRSARQGIDSKAQLAKIRFFLNVRYCTHTSINQKIEGWLTILTITWWKKYAKLR